MEKKNKRQEQSMKKGKKAATKKQKEPSRKAKYGTFFCIWWLLSRMWQWDKSLFLSSAALLPVAVGLYALGLYAPSLMLDSLQNAARFSGIVPVILGVVGAKFLFQLLHELLSGIRWDAGQKNIMRFAWEIMKTDGKRDFFLHHDEEYIKVYQRVNQVIPEKKSSRTQSTKTAFVSYRKRKVAGQKA